MTRHATREKAPLFSQDNFDRELRASLFAEERSGAQEHDPERRATPGVFVPEQLHGLRPVGDFLDLIEYESGTMPFPFARGIARRLPLACEPLAIAEGRYVGAQERHGTGGLGGDLLDERGLPHLSGAGDDLDVAPRFPEAFGEDRGLWANVGHGALLNVLSKNTQYTE